MHSYEASTRIDAPPSLVWEVLTDLRGWRDWDSGVDRVDGRVQLGEPVTVYATMIRRKPFRATVTEVRPEEGMRWHVGLPLGVAVIDRTYHLDPQDDGGTVLTVRELSAGPLSVLLDRNTPDLNPSFRQFCAGLKAVAERRAASTTA
jgi:uncharacterized protein YndB with AHSA1/START domain